MHAITPESLPITPDELSSAFYASGALRQGAILEVAVTKKFQTTISTLWFLEVSYSADSSPELPNQLVLKWPFHNSPAHDQGDPELTFYRELAPALASPPIVRCLATAAPTCEQQWLIMEDLRSTHTNPPWPILPASSPLHAAAAVLARVHARWWEAPELGSTVGTLHTDTSLRTMVHGISANLPAFIDHLGDDLPRADRLVLETVFSSSLKPWLRLVDPRRLTVIHGDAHTWNFLFPRSGHGMPYLIDWQLWHLDVGPRDLAFMIALHSDHDARQQLELSVLHAYHDELLAAGVSNYSFDDLLLEYRRCAVRNLTIPIILWSRGERREAWRYRLDYALAAYRDLNGAELL